MNIAVVGTGYVGLVSGACMAELGNKVWCIDIDETKIEALQRGEIPIYEPGLDTLVERNMHAGRLHFSTQLTEVLPHVTMLFIAVGTPSLPDGKADLRAVLNVATQVGNALQTPLLIVVKSTVPVGTTHMIDKTVRNCMAERKVSVPFDVASNPEFLKEGAAIDDFLYPDRVIVGVETLRARELMEALYRPIMRANFRVIFMDIRSAEMTKYASNAMLATRISFMNEVANLCEKVGADISMVRRGMGSDTRIGSKFLYPGCGYGGSCFPKDVQALLQLGAENEQAMEVLKAVHRVNTQQKALLFQKFKQYYKGHVEGRPVGVWGLAFKPETDDMREAPSVTLINELLAHHCQVQVYDPVAMDMARSIFGSQIIYATDVYNAVEGTDALFHVTEWKEFRMPNWERVRELMRTPLLIDGRNVFTDAPPVGIPYLWIGGAHYE